MQASRVFSHRGPQFFLYHFLVLRAARFHDVGRLGKLLGSAGANGFQFCGRQFLKRGKRLRGNKAVRQGVFLQIPLSYWHNAFCDSDVGARRQPAFTLGASLWTNASLPFVIIKSVIVDEFG